MLKLIVLALFLLLDLFDSGGRKGHRLRICQHEKTNTSR